MSRPTKSRRVCQFPNYFEFAPVGKLTGETIVMSVDEHEAIRLIDKEGLSQEQCGEQLGVGRTTAQNIYNLARKKIADALVLGHKLVIDGGDVSLCNGSNDHCYNGDCSKKRKGARVATTQRITTKVAVSYCDGDVFQHFGHSQQFKVYNVVNGEITQTTIVDTNGNGHGALVQLLGNLQVNALVCGGIGAGARDALAKLNVTVFGGVTGDADDAVQCLLNGNLQYDPNAQCNHHDGDHHCGQHDCASVE